LLENDELEGDVYRRDLAKNRKNDKKRRTNE